MGTVENSVELAITSRIAGARAGNARDAAVAAALIHRHPELSRRLSANSQYDGLLSQILLSQDAELVVCVAEELTKGKNLAVNASLAQRFFDRAEKLSPFMGAYVLGRLLVPMDVRRAMELFAKSEKAGHIPSAIRKHQVLSKMTPVVGRVVGLFLGLYDFILTWAAIRKGDRLNERFWRYRDVFPAPLEPVDENMGNADRANIFGDVEEIETCTSQSINGSKPVVLNHAT